MPKSLRSILGSSNRITKPSRPRQPSSSPRKSSTSTSSSSRKQPPKDKKDEDLFPDRLDDVGLMQLLNETLILRDVVQAMRYIRNHMFTSVPPTGFNSTRTTELLNHRRAFPPLVTASHLNSVLPSPSRTERELVELTRAGVLRRVRVERRGGMGEALIETVDLEAMLGRAEGVSADTRDRFMEFLRREPLAQSMSRDELDSSAADELVRAGFLTSAAQFTPGNTLHMRPEDRTTLTSIQHVSRFASGTVSAVGGRNAVYLAGGGGGAPALTHGAGAGDARAFRIAVPGHGRYLKLAEASVDWVREALARTKWGEGPESWLRERFEGGGLYGPRWKEFWGVEWEWVLGEAVGLGVVEVFDTGSVGRGVRALGG